MVKEIGNNYDFCPYQAMKKRVYNVNDKSSADFVLLPQNYLIDSDTRNSMEISKRLSHSFLIFDEAHNVLSSAEESSSKSITTMDLE